MDQQGAVCRVSLVESSGHCLQKLVQGGHGGVVGPEPVLDVGDRQVFCESRQDNSFQDFDAGTGW